MVSIIYSVVFISGFGVPVNRCGIQAFFGKKKKNQTFPADRDFLTRALCRVSALIILWAAVKESYSEPETQPQHLLYSPNV